MATTLNPYAVHLTGSTPTEVISETSDQLSKLIEQLGPKGLEQSYAPGKWTAREIVCHLADAEIAFAFRLRQTLAEPHHVIQPFDQDNWARSYRALLVTEALAAFTALRTWNLSLLKAAGPEALSRPVTHPERGAMTFQTIIQTMAGHDRNHLKQLETIAGQAK